MQILKLLKHFLGGEVVFVVKFTWRFILSLKVNCKYTSCEEIQINNIQIKDYGNYSSSSLVYLVISILLAHTLKK